MNAEVRIFGNFENGYSQYPDDFTRELFIDFYSRSTSASQILVHRQNNLVFYSYIRKLDNPIQYIGFCILLNSTRFNNIEALFTVFENAVQYLIEEGTIIQLNSNGNIIPNVKSLNSKKLAVQDIIKYIKKQISSIPTANLNPVNYSISNTESRSFTLDDKIDEIITATENYPYTYIYKDKNFDTDSITSYRKTLRTLYKEKEAYKKKCSDLSRQLSSVRAKQRNTTWVSILSVIVIIFGVVLWNSVLFPSEVTHYQTGQYVYYGPLNNNKKPHGIGVAIYPNNDEDERLFYFGNFVNGKREDTCGFLFYKQGNYFYGSMSNDHWKEGIFHSSSNNCYFRGKFRDNTPYDGDWYDFTYKYSLQNGNKTWRTKPLY